MSLTMEQQELRRSRIGASEVGAILGLDPYKSALEVFMSKVVPGEHDGKDHQRWGLDLEEPIVRFTARQHGYELIAPPDKAERWPSFLHPTWPLLATPDALAICKDGTIVIEAKNDQGYGQLSWGEPGTDDAPLLYVAQATVQIGVLLAKSYQVVRDDLTVSLRGAPPVTYPIAFDAELFGQIAEVCAKWVRDYLDTGKPPDGSPSEVAEYVKRRWARHGEGLLQPTPELTALVQRVQGLRKQAKALASDLTDAENQLKAAIGEAAGIAGLCTWKTQKGSTYQVTREPTRVLRMLGAKEE